MHEGLGVPEAEGADSGASQAYTAAIVSEAQGRKLVKWKIL